MRDALHINQIFRGIAQLVEQRSPKAQEETLFYYPFYCKNGLNSDVLVIIFCPDFSISRPNSAPKSPKILLIVLK